MAKTTQSTWVAKLALLPGQRVAWVNARPSLERHFSALPAGVERIDGLKGKKPLDVVIIFSEALSELADVMERARPRLSEGGALWAVFPSASSKKKTDITEGDVRGLAFMAGCVDDKVCALDDQWAAVRCVLRGAKR